MQHLAVICIPFLVVVAALPLIISAVSSAIANADANNLLAGVRPLNFQNDSIDSFSRLPDDTNGNRPVTLVHASGAGWGPPGGPGCHPRKETLP